MTSADYSQPREVEQRPSGPASLPDVLDRILDKGLVVAGDVTLQLLDVEILTIKVRLLLCSAEKAEEMGIDWWKHDPFLSGQAEQDKKLQKRVDKLESLLGSVANESQTAAGGHSSSGEGESSSNERESGPGRSGG